MLSDTLIRKLKTDTAFLEFVEYLTGKIEALDTIDGLENMTNEQAGEEAKVRSKAKATLVEILRPLFEFTEKAEPTAEQINKAKSKYGL